MIYETYMLKNVQNYFYGILVLFIREYQFIKTCNKQSQILLQDSINSY